MAGGSWNFTSKIAPFNFGASPGAATDETAAWQDMGQEWTGLFTIPRITVNGWY